MQSPGVELSFKRKMSPTTKTYSGIGIGGAEVVEPAPQN